MSLTHLDGGLLGTINPSAEDARIAQESSRKLEEILRAGRTDIRIHVQPQDKPEETVSIPLPVFRILTHILTQVAHGNGVTVIPMHAELTPHQAAHVLKVSRPFLIGLLEKG